VSSYARSFAQRYIEVEMTRDAARIAAMFRPHGRLVTPTATVEGRDALERYYAEFIAPMAEIRLELGRVVGDRGELAFEWFGRTRYDDGHWVRASGCDVLTLEDGAIAHSMVHIHRIEEEDA
jgi:hypothetical protein